MGTDSIARPEAGAPRRALAQRQGRRVGLRTGEEVVECMLMAARRPILAMLMAARRPIWQVHRAVLRTGEEVVVKVQRENLLDLFAIDLWNIKLAAWLADRFDPQTEATAANWKVR